MIDNYTLKVNSIIPQEYSTSNNINSKIEMYFNLELDTSSITENIFILKDENRTLIKNDSVSIPNESIVIGTFSYKNKTVIFSPKEPLLTDCRYIIYVRKDIYDISKRTLERDFIGYFDTESVGTLLPCNIISPTNNSLIKELVEIELEYLNSDKYLLQISKVKEFTSIYKEYYSDCSTVKIEPLPSGLFYIRAKAINGDFGETIFITVKAFKDTIVSNEDTSDDFFYEQEEIIDDGISLEKCAPFDGEVSVSPFTNCFHLEVNGHLPYESLDIYSIFIEEALIDEDDLPLNIAFDTLNNFKDFHLSHIYDDNKNKTYITLILKKVGG